MDLLRDEVEYPILLHPSVDVVDGTKIIEYMTCKRKFFFNYVLGWRKASNHLVFGKCVHAAMEILYTKGYTLEAVKEGIAKFYELYEQAYPDTSTWDDYAPKTPARFSNMLLAYMAHYQNEDKRYAIAEVNGKKLVEVAGTCMISERHAVAFRMDTIFKNDENRIFSLEHKTASSMYMLREQHEFSFQVFMYNFVLAMWFGIENVDGVVINNMVFKKTVAGGPAERRDGIAAHFEFNRLRYKKQAKDLNFWLTLANLYCDDMEREFLLFADIDNAERDVMLSFPCNMSSCTKYNGCEYKALCMYIHNPLREAAYGAPPGFVQEFWNPLEEESNVKVEVSENGGTFE